MPSFNFSEESITFVRDEINNLLGFQLSEEEIRTLLAGEALSFQKLMQNRSLSEIGMALIRADTLNRLSTSSIEALKSECPSGCRVIRSPITGKKIACWCVDKSPLEIRLH